MQNKTQFRMSTGKSVIEIRYRNAYLIMGLALYWKSSLSQDLSFRFLINI